jgi:hypothetical protein
MAKFDKVIAALTQGQSVRRENWDPDVHMFVRNDSLMYQHGVAKPWQCALSWDEIVAADWRLLKAASGAQQVQQIAIAAERPLLLLVEELALPKSFSQVRSHFDAQPLSFPLKPRRLLR